MEILLLFGKEEVPSRKPCWENARDIKKKSCIFNGTFSTSSTEVLHCAGCMMTGNWESNTAVGVIKSPSRKHTHKYTLCHHTWRDPCLSRELPNLSAPSEEPGLCLNLSGRKSGCPFASERHSHRTATPQTHSALWSALIHATVDPWK